MSRPRSLVVLVALLAGACGRDDQNPFDQLSRSRPPSSDAVLLFLSGSWTEETGAPRELFAVSADGSEIERLTTCTQATQPCDFMHITPSRNRSRIAAVRTTPGAEPGTAALYFMDLGRSVETVIAVQRRVSAVDWSLDDAFLLFSASDPLGNEDLYTVRPNGSDERNITGTSLPIRERSPRISPFGSSAVYEHIGDEAPGAVALFLADRSVAFLTPGGDVSQPLPGTPYFVGSDADPCFAPDGQAVAFRRLTGTGSGGLGTWDLLLADDTGEDPRPIAAGGSVHRGAPDWGLDGIVFVETDVAADEARLVVVQPDGSGRRVLHVERAAYGMASPRWLR